MPTPTPTRLPKYRHYKLKDLAVVRLDGRDHDLGKYDSEESREKYRRLVAEWLAAGRSARPNPGAEAVAEQAGDPIVSELILTYIKFVALYYVKEGRPTVEPGNIRLVMRIVRRLYEKLRRGQPSSASGPGRASPVQSVIGAHTVLRPDLFRKRLFKGGSRS